MARRKSSLVWKIVTVIAVVIIVRLLWSWLFSSSPSRMQAPLLVGDYNLVPGQREMDFRGSSCVYIDGKCVPESEANVHIPAKGLYTYGNSFFLDGSPFRIISGSFHYFRTQPAQWGDRLLKMKAAGLNTITTYVPWNLHETVRGQFNFVGMMDLESFIKHVQNVGLKMIIRPGPYICSEWEFGGLPSWLLSDPNMVVRSSSYKPFLQAVEDYFSKLLPLLSKHQYKKGNGPVIAFQVENEFGSYGKDPKYLKFVKGLFDKYGIDELLFTSDGKSGTHYGNLDGAVEGALITMNFMRHPEEHLDYLEQIQPGKPMMVAEFWAGWFDHWGEKHHTTAVDSFIETVSYILGKRNASINFYMFTGGTNFGFWNGANNGSDDGYGAAITSYDYDAPISECGDLKPKFFAIQNLIKTLGLGPMEWIDTPKNSSKKGYGMVKLQEYISYYDILNLIEDKIALEKAVTMENLPINNKGGQGYGWLLYRTKVGRSQKGNGVLEISGKVEDRAQVVVNGKEIGVLPDRIRYQYSSNNAIKIPLTAGENTLDIFVENLGRVNFKHMLNQERKGIDGQVYIDKEKIQKWTHIPFEFNEKLVTSLRGQTSSWKQFKPQFVPTAYRGYLDIRDSTLEDTFLDMDGWTKGVVFLNGYNLGRYWNLGPQRTLYVPAPLLVTGSNDLIVFELHEPGEFVKLVDKPML